MLHTRARPAKDAPLFTDAERVGDVLCVPFQHLWNAARGGQVFRTMRGLPGRAVPQILCGTPAHEYAWDDDQHRRWFSAQLVALYSFVCRLIDGNADADDAAGAPQARETVREHNFCIPGATARNVLAVSDVDVDGERSAVACRIIRVYYGDVPLADVSIQRQPANHRPHTATRAARCGVLVVLHLFDTDAGARHELYSWMRTALRNTMCPSWNAVDLILAVNRAAADTTTTFNHVPRSPAHGASYVVTI